LSSKGRSYSERYNAGLAPEPRFEKVLAISRKLGGERLLDIGCGDGSFTLLLKEALDSREAVGIEIAPQAIPLIEKRGIKACQMDIDEKGFPFEDSYFDMVYCGEIIEHLFDTDHLLEEVYRVVKPQGSAIFSTPNLAGWASRLALLLGYQPYPTAVSPENEGAGKLLARGAEGQWGHIRVFTAGALVELLKVHRFKVIDIIGCPVSLKTASSKSLTALAGVVDRAMTIFPGLSSRVIVVVKKKE
jgi:methionine biosynthesis protein MetW